jgi:hypothetical protein
MPASAEGHRKRLDVLVRLNAMLTECIALESPLRTARDEYVRDCILIAQYIRQLQNEDPDIAQIQQKLTFTRRSVGETEAKYLRLQEEANEAIVAWQKDWVDFCDWLQDEENVRVNLLKTIAGKYAKVVSATCVTDDDVRRFLQV